jgi:hypothetical protein
VNDTTALDGVVARLSAAHPALPPGRILRCVLRCRRELRSTGTGLTPWPAIEELAASRLDELRQTA